jgi:hypothetical protein
MPPRSLRASASASSLPRLPSSYASSTHSRRASDAPAQPTLAELIQAEERALEQGDLADADEAAARRVRQRRRSSAPGMGVAGDVTPPRPRFRTSETSPVASPVPQNDLLLPPHYGRPNRPSSPDVLA